MNENNKKLFGQFFTTTNPFEVNAFYEWLERIPLDDIKVLEPFAGANNIVNFIKRPANECGKHIEWAAYDIDTSFTNNAPEVHILKRDTLANYPIGFDVAITNPPYLARNSATRAGLPFPETQYDDIYKLALHVMLENTKYVAAIIPESFLTTGLFVNRLDSVVSLTCKMFNDTDCPVCLALFVPEYAKDRSDDFIVYRQNHLIGSFLDIKEKVEDFIKTETKEAWKFNDKNGEIGIKCIDGTKEPSIKFVKGDEIPSEKIKCSSRSLTRVHNGLITDTERFIDACNRLLSKYREITQDIFLTSFKGLREDECYRRRLDYKTAKDILNKAFAETNGGNYA